MIMKNFTLIGAAGYIAPRHLEAIKSTGNNLIAALDKHDAVGVLDSYFPDCSFFTEFERFDRYLEKMKHEGNPCDFLSVCSPNYLHDSHIRFGIRSGMDVICEKPLVVTPWQMDWLLETENCFDNKIFTILQLRLHPSILSLKKKVNDNPDKKFDIDLTYITPRGKWYDVSWKGDNNKSGGIVCNIGIHFFDILFWIFGKRELSIVNAYEHNYAGGYMELERAKVRWFLSIRSDDLPNPSDKQPYRSIRIDGEEIEFSSGFKDLHTKSYQEILNGKGFGITDSKEAIYAAYEISNSKPIGLRGDFHSYLRK